MDFRQSPEFAQYMQKINWQVGKERGLQFYIKKLPLLGNFIKIPRPPIPPNSQQIKSLAKKYRAFAVRVDYSPTKTLQLDITPSLEKILSQTQKDTRYEIRKAEKSQVKVEQSEDIDGFIKMWRQNALRRGFWIPFGKEIKSIYEAFGLKAHLLLAYSMLNTKYPLRSEASQIPTPLAGAIILIHNKTAYYFYAASTPDGRRVSSPCLVIWEAIKIAKNKGCRVFDFEGIKDNRNKDTKNWGGFTRFKKGFGGQEIEYPLPKTTYFCPLINF